jgi:DNA polymerase
MTPFAAPDVSTFDDWRCEARRLVAAGVPPEAVVWSGGPSLLPAAAPAGTTAGGFTVPARFIEAASAAACFRDDGRWALLYRILWRLTHGEPKLLDVVVDDDVHRLLSMEKAVRRDSHKMKAFVRFRKLVVDGVEHYIAWHRPDHLIVARVAPWFRDRFGSLRWTILTPDASATWDGTDLVFGPGVPRSAAPEGDALEDLWRTYYASIFNPARVSIPAMRREMPLKHWPTLPETQVIDELLRDAPARVEDMMKRQARATQAPTTVPGTKPARPTAPAGGYQDYASCPVGSSAAEFIPKTTSLTVLKEAVNGCRGCPIYCNATQGVFGEGPKAATVMFVGEQPGDQEDRAGKPFVGPAGQVLDEALEAAGIPRDETYVTNAVKHFKWEPRGTRRLHSKPSAREVAACRPWLETELSIVKPKMVVCLGATAAQSLMGPAFRITKQRGEVFADTSWAPWLMATVHPSSILRIPEDDLRQRARADFIDDIRKVAKQLRSAHAGS